MSSIGSPFNSNGAIWLCFSNLGKLIKVPEIDFASQVTKTSNHCNLWEGTNLNCVSIPFSELEQCVTIQIVKCWCSWLYPGNYNESFSIWYPSDVLNHVFKNWHKLPVSSTKYLNILEWVLAVIALSCRINQALRPDQNCMPSWTKLSHYVLALRAANHELWLFRT